MKAWVFLKLTPKKTLSAVKAIRQIEGVHAADAVTGMWDAFALVEAEDLQDMAGTVLSQVGGVDGVEDTLTNLVFEW